MLLQTCTLFFIETQNVHFEKYSGLLFQYNQRECMSKKHHNKAVNEV